MADFTFEMGFDWNMAARGSAIGILYALQWSVVDNRKGILVSPVHRAAIREGDTLDFRVYDITEPSQPPPAPPGPRCLQVLFNNAADLTSSDFTPIAAKVPELTITAFDPLSQGPAGFVESIAYGSVTLGWDVPGSEVKLANAGRFELRTMVTVTASDQIARYYQVDPEMAVGGGGGG